MIHRGFFQYGHFGTDLNDSSYEDFMVADREGLVYLKSRIDDVLNGTDQIAFDDNSVITNLNGIRIAQRDLETKPETFMDKYAAPIGCFILLVLLVGVLVCGVWKIRELIG